MERSVAGELSSQDVTKLEKALGSLLKYTELAGDLAQILLLALKTGRVCYKHVEGMAKGDLEDVLLQANEWRLLLPVRTFKSSAWEDQALLVQPGEAYEMPIGRAYFRKLVVSNGKSSKGE